MTKTIKDPNQMVEAEIIKMLEILKNGSTNDQKRKSRKEIIRLEKHIRDKQDEYLNGKKYPERMYHSDDKPMKKKELLELIDSVDSTFFGSTQRAVATGKAINEIDLSGVSVGKNRFEFIEKGKVETSILDGKK